MPGRGSLGRRPPERCSSRAAAGVGSAGQADAGAVAIRALGSALPRHRRRRFGPGAASLSTVCYCRAMSWILSVPVLLFAGVLALLPRASLVRRPTTARRLAPRTSITLRRSKAFGVHAVLQSPGRCREHTLRGDGIKDDHPRVQSLCAARSSGLPPVVAAAPQAPFGGVQHDPDIPGLPAAVTHDPTEPAAATSPGTSTMPVGSSPLADRRRDDAQLTALRGIQRAFRRARSSWQPPFSTRIVTHGLSPEMPFQRISHLTWLAAAS
jgi:hypothetical protein